MQSNFNLGKSCLTLQFCDTGDKDLMDWVRKCSSVSELVNLCTDMDIKETIEDQMIQKIDSQLQSLSNTGEFGSVFPTPTTATAISGIAEKAIDELRKPCPFLYKILLMASSSATVEKKDDWHLFTLYGFIMQRRSQRFNALQRLLMTEAWSYWHSFENLHRRNCQPNWEMHGTSFLQIIICQPRCVMLSMIWIAHRS